MISLQNNVTPFLSLVWIDGDKYREQGKEKKRERERKKEKGRGRERVHVRARARKHT